MDTYPPYLVFIGLGILVAVLAAQLKQSNALNRLALLGLIASAGLLIYGIVLFTQEPEPCGGMETLEGASWDEMECVASHLEDKEIPK
jgi:hypothetical protein